MRRWGRVGRLGTDKKQDCKLNKKRIAAEQYARPTHRAKGRSDPEGTPMGHSFILRGSAKTVGD